MQAPPMQAPPMQAPRRPLLAASPLTLSSLPALPAARSCPRWFFPLPPFSNASPTHGADPKSYRDTLCGSQIREFNVALCSYYSRHCRVPPECPPADGENARRALREAPGSACVDLTQNCLSWARMGECDSNPAFMASECAQSCGKCDAAKHPAMPFLGAPDVSCRDDGSGAHASAGGCASLAALGACDSQRAHMQEHCRRTCNFCNASKDAFKDSGGSGHGSEDTAAHSCPDGTDLGGGQVLVEAKGAEAIAEASAIDDDGDGHTAQPAHTGGPATAAAAVRGPAAATGDGGASLPGLAEGRAAATEQAAPVVQPAPKAEARRSLGKHLLTGGGTESLDSGMLSWPFALVQGLCMVGVGYFLRGYLDRRSKRRRPQLPFGHSL